MTLNIYVGYDPREPKSFNVTAASIRRHASEPVLITPLHLERLAETGLLRRPQDTRGQRYDFLSNAAASTEFAISRFLVPILAQTDWALYAESDQVFLGDVTELFEIANPQYAVMCVKHRHEPIAGTKMDAQVQMSYPRKNWSSLMLFNCDHPANKRLSLVDVQERRGLDLHKLYWLNDDEIGELPMEWNWLVNVQPKPERPKVAHFTLGTPELGVSSPHDGLWYAECA